MIADRQLSLSETRAGPDPLSTKPHSIQAPGKTVTLHGSDQAPIITFDEVLFFGVLHGIGRITLAAQVMSQTGDNGAVLSDHRVTVHLNGSLQAMAELRSMVDKLLLVASTPGEKAN
jgi:hypothetical protein